jgi:hypothetical protein
VEEKEGCAVDGTEGAIRQNSRRIWTIACKQNDGRISFKISPTLEPHLHSRMMTMQAPIAKTKGLQKR